MGLSLPLKSGSAGESSPFLKEVVVVPFRQLRGDRDSGLFLLVSVTTAGESFDDEVAGDLPVSELDVLLLEPGVVFPGVWCLVARRFEGDDLGDSDRRF